MRSRSRASAPRIWSASGGQTFARPGRTLRCLAALLPMPCLMKNLSWEGCWGGRSGCMRQSSASAGERRSMNRGKRLRAGCAMLVALTIAVLTPAHADQWTVEKAGFNLYRATGRTIGAQSVFIRTEGCDDAPVTGVVNIQKEGGTRRLTFGDSAASCTVRDFLVPAKVESDRYNVLNQKIDRKSTRLNSSHQIISYAVFCLKKKITCI